MFKVVVLSLLLLQVQCYKIMLYGDNTIEITCDINEFLDSLKPIDHLQNNINGTKKPSRLEFYKCPPPSKPYFQRNQRGRFSNKIEQFGDDAIEITCDVNESLDSLKPVNHLQSNINGAKTPSKLEFNNCPSPQKPYFEISKEINFDASRVTKLFIWNMNDTGFLKESLFMGMPLRDLGFSTQYIDYYVSVNSSENLDLGKCEKYVVYCRGQDINKIKPILPKRLKNVSHISFWDCSAPNTNSSFYNIFQEIKINPHSVEKIFLSLKRNALQLRPSHFKGLSLRELEVSNVYYELDPKIFEEVAPEEVKLTFVTLRTFPKFTAKVAELSDGMFIGEWGDCSNLNSLSLESFNVPDIADGWLHNCSNLTVLTLRDLSQRDVDQTLKGVRALTELTLERCNYPDATLLPFAGDAVNLKTLKFVSSSLSAIDSTTFCALKELKELDLSGNQLHEVAGIFEANIIKALENTPGWSGLKRGSVRDPSLSQGEGVEVCVQDWHKLAYLNLSNNKISDLYLGPVPREHPLVVDLRGNPLKTLSNNNVIEDLKDSQNITILLDFELNCDCEHSTFLRNIRALPQIRLQNATCTKGDTFQDFATKNHGCNKYSCDKCTCRTSWIDGTTIADCQLSRLHTLPDVWTSLQTTYEEQGYEGRLKVFVKDILASGNFIESLIELKYPESLVEIDLSNNKITRISQNALTALFHGGNRRVHLSGNPFICDCEAQDMIEALTKNRNQIPDYANLTCSYSGQKLFIYELTNRSLCAERALVAFGIVSLSLLALAAICAFIFVRYKLTIKAFLYARGLCLSCVREEELDADREYDAFVSFAHPDDEFVADVLLPGLENDYKLCVHTQNWMPGEMIHTQIMESVQKSRRTIIVLSKSFVESMWGMTEFRIAYSNSLREGRVRVICVVMDDVINDVNLDSELKSYLKSNTYLKFNDPWFWKKLRYAMPHPNVTSDRNVQNQNDNENIQLNSS